MRNLILIILSFITLNCYSQEIVEIPQDELEEFFQAIDTLKQQDSIKTILISDLDLQLKNFKLLSTQDSLILNYRNQEISILKDQIKLYDGRLKQVDKWYNKPWIGVASGIIGTLVTIHIIDYSLPK
tara:strand:- start:2018 stop:2398 length:381 start_codon:yes stop_codon:yes gene_type:complete